MGFLKILLLKWEIKIMPKFLTLFQLNKKIESRVSNKHSSSKLALEYLYYERQYH